MKIRSGFNNDAADKIWNDHLGNNAFVRHRDQCASCIEAMRMQVPGQQTAWCAEGDRIFFTMIDEIYEKIEVLVNQN